MVASLGDTPLDIRDRAILLTFFASGLRESELANLKLSDIHLDSGMVKVWEGKGGKDGIVPLSPPAIAALKEYLTTVRPAFNRNGLRGSRIKRFMGL
jgi:site-specific recombinase XerD